MKNAITILAGLMLTFSAFAQDAINKYFSQYEKSDEFTKVTVSAKMFELFTHMEGVSEDEQEILETIAKLKGMRMIALRDGSDSAVAMYEKALKKPGTEFEVLMTIEDELEDMTFLIQENGGKISELLLIGRAEREFFVLSLLGDIDLKEVSKLSRNLQISGMEHLNRIEEK